MQDLNMEHVNQNNSKHLDERLNSSFLVIQKFINLLMNDGKKSQATKLFHDALIQLKKRLNATTNEQVDVLKVFFQALENVTPSFEVRKVRRAGSTFLVPAMISESRGKAQAIRWIIEAAQSRRGSNSANYKFAHCLADEIYQASLNQGKAREKRKELHNVAIANRAYVRYRWW